ncbi:ABC transporter ATP-binding protein [Planctomycetota bacterium]|nr:ABC transporter ATP-binding protein [Planctomycetota bacterium]
MLLALVGILIDLVWPLVQIHLVDGVILNPDLSPELKESSLIFWALVALPLFLFGSLVSLYRSIRTTRLNGLLAFDLRSRLFGLVLHLPLSDDESLKTGGVLSRLSTDVDSTTGLVQSGFMNPVLAAIRLLLTLGLMFGLNWRIALVSVIALPPIMFLQAHWIRRIRPIWRSMGQDRQEIDGRVGEALAGLRVVRTFRREKREELTYAVGHHTVLRKQLLATTTQGTIGLVWELVMPLTTVGILCIGGLLVIHGHATLGVVMAFIGLALRLMDPVLAIVNSISETQRGLAAMERVFELLDKPAEKPDRPGAVEASPTVNELRFENVSFAYRADVRVLERIDLHVRGGSTVALVGPSGSGKTTMTDLLARFHDPTDGRITLDGIDLRDLRLGSYRSRIAIVQQETFLFDGTISENIAYPRREATESEVHDAARRANAEEFILRLPEAYGTCIGERGVKLSGGQRQRLSIARALLADPAILILDEATSHLDTESERLIQASLGELLKGRTTFVIAHRLSTIAQADLILVLDRGILVERGNHNELMEQRGRYRTMVEHQFSQS